MVLTVEVSSRDFVDVWVLVVLVVDVELLKTDCVGSLLNIVVEKKSWHTCGEHCSHAYV